MRRCLALKKRVVAVLAIERVCFSKYADVFRLVEFFFFGKIHRSKTQSKCNGRK